MGVAQTDALSMLRNAMWIGPWILGQVVIGALGRYGGHDVLPNWVDLVVVVVFSLVIYYWAVSLTMSRERVQMEVAKDSAQIDYVPAA